MARKLDRFPEELLSRTTSTYPWDEWLDGDVWELTKGEDFNIKAKSLRTTGQAVARKKGGRLRVAEADNGNKMVIQYLPNRNGNVTVTPSPSRDRSGDEKSRVIRAWAKENGYPDLSDHGRLPADVIQAYERAKHHPSNVRPING